MGNFYYCGHYLYSSESRNRFLPIFWSLKMSLYQKHYILVCLNLNIHTMTFRTAIWKVLGLIVLSTFLLSRIHLLFYIVFSRKLPRIWEYSSNFRWNSILLKRRKFCNIRYPLNVPFLLHCSQEKYFALLHTHEHFHLAIQ